MKTVMDAILRLRRQAWFAFNRTAFSGVEAVQRPRVLVDLSVIARHDARTGIQRVVRAIWTELERRRHADYDFVPIYAGASHGYRYAKVGSSSGRVDFTKAIVRGRTGDKFLGLDLSAHYLPHCSAQLAAWRAVGVSLHNVVYDLLPLKNPDWFTPTARQHFRRWFEAITKLSDQLLCISNSVAEEVRVEIGDVTRPSVGRLWLSGNIAGSSPSAGRTECSRKLLQDVSHRATVLMVGTIEPRKGYDAALRAFEWLWTHRAADAPNLLIVGKPGWRTEGLQQALKNHPELGHRLHWHTRVSDEVLTDLYDNCSAVLVASYGEGFGLPLSEAAFHRKWALVRDLSVFREQALSNCLFFDNDAPDMLGPAIVDLVDHATQSLPPAAPLMNWTDCLERLLESLGVDPERLVSNAEDSPPALAYTDNE